nr:metal ABC transporter substrate-binding protein [uncultured Agathobacter sp.]
MKKKCRFVGIMFLCIIIVCTVLVMIYERATNNNTKENENFTVVTSFYPMYIAALNIVDGADGVTLENLSEPQTGCLHDFQLTPEDMKLLSTADMFVINGGGIESFMSDVAKAYPDLTVVEACKNVELINESEEDVDTHDHDNEADSDETDHDHETDSDESGHDHDHGDENAHAWMSVAHYRVMVSTIAESLSKADPSNAAIYDSNAKKYDAKLAELEEKENEIKQKTAGNDIIIFHEAYEYVADDFGMNVCYLMDLDEECAVSAGEVSDVINAVRNDGVSVILAEELYGKDLGDTVSRETDVKMVYIDPLNRGNYDKNSYIEGMEKNFELIEAAF